MSKEFALAIGVAVAVPIIVFTVLALCMWILHTAFNLLNGDADDD